MNGVRVLALALALAFGIGLSGCEKEPLTSGQKAHLAEKRKMERYWSCMREHEKVWYVNRLPPDKAHEHCLSKL